MLPVKTDRTDRNFGPPPGKEDEIGNLPYYFEEIPEGYTEVVSIWEPSEAERRAIATGQCIRLGIGWIGKFPPVSLGVTPEGMRDAHSPEDVRPAESGDEG